ncbi:MAG: DUF6252 family protein, partial [Bacteroidota bacterium]
NIYSLVFALCSLLLVAGCGDDDSDDPSAPQGQLSVRINDGLWTSVEAGAELRNGFISLAAIDANGDNVAILLKGEETGVYEVEDLFQSGSSVPDNTVAYTAFGGITFTSAYDIETTGGTVTVTELDTANNFISGTFDVNLARNTGSGDSVINLTQGAFNRIQLVVEADILGNNEFSAKVDGVDFQPNIIGGTVAVGTIVLSFSKNSGETIGLTVPSNINNGSYTLGGLGSTYSASYIKSATESFFADSGTLTITNHNTDSKQIEGTFNFTATPLFGSGSISITEGSFQVNY